MKSLFQAGRPVLGEKLIGREEIIKIKTDFNQKCTQCCLKLFFVFLKHEKCRNTK